VSPVASEAARNHHTLIAAFESNTPSNRQLAMSLAYSALCDPDLDSDLSDGEGSGPPVPPPQAAPPSQARPATTTSLLSFLSKPKPAQIPPSQQTVYKEAATLDETLSTTPNLPPAGSTPPTARAALAPLFSPSSRRQPALTPARDPETKPVPANGGAFAVLMSARRRPTAPEPIPAEPPTQVQQEPKPAPHSFFLTPSQRKKEKERAHAEQMAQARESLRQRLRDQGSMTHSSKTAAVIFTRAKQTPVKRHDSDLMPSPSCSMLASSMNLVPFAPRDIRSMQPCQDTAGPDCDIEATIAALCSSAKIVAPSLACERAWCPLELRPELVRCRIEQILLQSGASLERRRMLTECVQRVPRGPSLWQQAFRPQSVPELGLMGNRGLETNCPRSLVMGQRWLSHSDIACNSESAWPVGALGAWLSEWRSFLARKGEQPQQPVECVVDDGTTLSQPPTAVAPTRSLTQYVFESESDGTSSSEEEDDEPPQQCGASSSGGGVFIRGKRRSSRVRSATHTASVCSSDGWGEDASMSGGVPPPPPVFVLYGPAGVGKVSCVESFAASLGFHALEIDAGKERSKAALYKAISEAIQSHSLNTSSKEAPRSRRKNRRDEQAAPSFKHTLVLLSSVHALFPQDSAVETAIQSLAVNARRPIVLVADEYPRNLVEAVAGALEPHRQPIVHRLDRAAASLALSTVQTALGHQGIEAHEALVHFLSRKCLMGATLAQAQTMRGSLPASVAHAPLESAAAALLPALALSQPCDHVHAFQPCHLGLRVTPMWVPADEDSCLSIHSDSRLPVDGLLQVRIGDGAPVEITRVSPTKAQVRLPALGSSSPQWVPVVLESVGAWTSVLGEAMLRVKPPASGEEGVQYDDCLDDDASVCSESLSPGGTTVLETSLDTSLTEEGPVQKRPRSLSTDSETDSKRPRFSVSVVELNPPQSDQVDVSQLVQATSAASFVDVISRAVPPPGCVNGPSSGGSCRPNSSLRQTPALGASVAVHLPPLTYLPRTCHVSASDVTPLSPWSGDLFDLAAKCGVSAAAVSRGSNQVLPASERSTGPEEGLSHTYRGDCDEAGCSELSQVQGDGLSQVGYAAQSRWARDVDPMINAPESHPAALAAVFLGKTLASKVPCLSYSDVLALDELFGDSALPQVASRLAADMGAALASLPPSRTSGTSVSHILKSGGWKSAGAAVCCVDRASVLSSVCALDLREQLERTPAEALAGCVNSGKDLPDWDQHVGALLSAFPPALRVYLAKRSLAWE
jgi:hypothetical protein